MAQNALPDWQEMQQQLLKGWMDATRSVGANDGLRAWQQAMGGGSANDTVEKLVGGAKQFTDFMQGVFSQMGGGAADAFSPAAIRKAVEQGFSSMAPGNPVLDALRSVNHEGARGFEALFGEWQKQAGPIKQELQSLLSLPAFGYARESQERAQALVRAVAEYQEQNNRYNELMMKATRIGFDRFESKLAERSEPGREISHFRALYDVYIDAAEEGYADVALSDEFREVYGAMVNAQMRVRQLVQADVERQTAALGMPGRSELDTVHQRLHELRRRVAALEEGVRNPSSQVDSKAPAEAPVPAKAAAPAKSRASAKPTTPARTRTPPKPVVKAAVKTAQPAKRSK